MHLLNNLYMNVVSMRMHIGSIGHDGRGWHILILEQGPAPEAQGMCLNIECIYTIDSIETYH